MIGELIRWPSFHVRNGLKLKKKQKKKQKKTKKKTKKKQKQMLALTIESLKLMWIKAKYFCLFKTKEERNSPKSPQRIVF